MFGGAGKTSKQRCVGLASDFVWAYCMCFMILMNGLQLFLSNIRCSQIVFPILMSSSVTKKRDTPFTHVTHKIMMKDT